jgi:two-component system chemotaxis response regulator CheY
MVMAGLTRVKLADFEFVEAEDGADALAKFNELKDISIIFADWNMPNMSGIDFAKKIRSSKKNNHIPIIMVTSEKTVGKMNDALSRGGANAYICKPFTDVELERKLEKIIAEIPDPSDKPAGGGFFSKLVGGNG